MELTILVALIAIVWLVSSKRWRRRFVTPGAIAVLICILLTSPVAAALANWGLVFSLPSDSGERVDAIVVLGRGEELRNRRVELVSQLWQAKRAPKIFISGMLDAYPIIEQLKEDGIPKRQLSGEGCSQKTEENAEYTAAVLYPQKVRKILLITDPPHMLRSLLLFRSYGFTVLPYFSPLPPKLSSKDQVLLMAREYLGLLRYKLEGRFEPRPQTELEHPSAAVLSRFSAWNCLR